MFVIVIRNSFNASYLACNYILSQLQSVYTSKQGYRMPDLALIGICMLTALCS